MFSAISCRSFAAALDPSLRATESPKTFFQPVTARNANTVSATTKPIRFCSRVSVFIPALSHRRAVFPNASATGYPVGRYLFGAAAAVALLLTVSGCATTDTRGSRLLPWNWFASDSTARVEKAEGKVDGANTALRKNAQEMTAAGKAAIAAEKNRQLGAGGEVSREIESAEDYLERADNDLSQSEGPLPAARIRELEEMVRLRNSQIADERKRGDAALTKLDRLAQTAAATKVKGELALADAHKRVGEEQQRALIAEEKYNRMWFIIWAIVIGLLVFWIGGQVLTRLAQANPVLAPIAAAYNMIAAPALKAQWQKVSDIPSRVGKFMAGVRKEIPTAARDVEYLLNGVMDDHHQNEIGASATAAGAGPKT